MREITLPIVGTVVFTFLIYLAIGIQLSILPSYVVSKGFGSLTAGLVISVQYVATLASRPYAGRMADESGPKKSVVYGLVACGVSGVLLWLSSRAGLSSGADLGLLVAGRLALGVGESWISTGSMLWAIARVGAGNTADVIAWNGIATYGALALGAPLGVIVEKTTGFQGIGCLVFALGAIALPFALAKPATAVLRGAALPLRQVMSRVLPFGLTLALGAVGFGTIAAFITLDYASHHWSNAVSCLSLFGVCFVGSRLFFSGMIGQRGGFQVALVSFATECMGLLLIWLAPSPSVALAGAALSGLGFSLVFPALGVEVIGTIPPQNRGTVLGLYSAFLDLALGVTGPIAGLVAARFGYASAFLTAAGAAGAGAGMTQYLQRRNRPVLPQTTLPSALGTTRATLRLIGRRART